MVDERNHGTSQPLTGKIIEPNGQRSIPMLNYWGARIRDQYIIQYIDVNCIWNDILYYQQMGY